ncbi:sulfotransferase family protein, partial [Acidisphaera rubrifaciens]|uniref:sulfotransferase family protein n=1 Tax=Acidisphaera rubrifaciens TaxID=50715 RepID=UPI000662B012
EAPDDPVLAAQWRIHRSAALQATGDLAGARAAVDSADVPPGMASALASRRLALAPRDDPAAVHRAAEAAEAALAVPGETAEARINGHFNLGRFWSRRDERDRAFDHWRTGHDLLRPLQPFSRARFAEFVGAMEEVFDAARLRDGPRADSDDPSPVFIVGMPRSGTTLAEQILAAHPMIHGAGERSALAFAYAALAGDAEMESRDAALRVAGQDRATLTAASLSYLAALRALAPEASRIVDKMPGNFRILGFLTLLLPGARVIHCVRDPRDIGFSIFTLRFYGHHAYAHDLADLGWYIGMHHRLMTHWAAAAPMPILRVHLHDWIDDLRGTTARVLDFIGLPYDAACERFHELDREVRTASRDQVRRPVNRAGMGRWRDYADQLAPMIEALQDTGALPGRTAGG